MFPMKKTTWLTIFGLIVLILLWYMIVQTNKWLDKKDEEKIAKIQEQVDKEITIAMVTFPWYWPFYLAEEKNLWPEGYDVNLVRIESLGDMRTAMKAGKIDMYAGTYDMFLATEGAMPPGTAVLALDESTGGDGVAVVGWVESLQDLVGAEVTAEAGLPPHFMLMYALYQEGLSLDDINFNDVPSSDAAAAFIAGRADIMWTYEPYLSNAIASRDDSEILLSSSDTPGLIVDLLWASDKMIAQGDAVDAIVKGWYDSLAYLEANPEEWYEIMGEAFGVDAEEMKGFDEGVDWLDEEANKNLFDKENENSVYANYKTVQEVLEKNGVQLYPTKAENKITWTFVSVQ